MSSLKEKLSEQAEAREFNGLGWLLVLVTLVLFSLAIIYFGGGTGGDSNPIAKPSASHSPRTYSVYYSNGFFQPTNMRIQAGDTVRFTDKDIAPIGIVGNGNDLSDFDSHTTIGKDETFVYTFTKVGVFGYHNSRNPNEIGTIIVR